jgi:hypothetical protein
MRRAWLVALVGCFNPNYGGNGALQCDDGKCPSGYHCAGNDTCWKNGSDPDLAVPEDLAAVDAAEDFSSTDLAGGMRHLGQACNPNTTCDTGHCVDGYCCDSSCEDTCRACNVLGSEGFCTNVGAGLSPVGGRSCMGEAASTCRHDGKCDGVGNCRDWPSGTVCVAGTCATGTGDFTNPSTCNGSGACVANGGGNCAPYKCQDTTQCWSSCTNGDNSHCSGTNVCANSSCGLLPNSRQCGTNGAQCQSGNCVDGYCCDLPCTEACKACNVPMHLGACTTVPMGPPVAPRTCTNQLNAQCGGRCDGIATTCSYPATSVSCGTACPSMSLVRKSFCDGAGSCAALSPSPCPGNYACVGSSCLNACSGDGDCGTTAYGCEMNTTSCVAFCSLDDSNLDECILK